MSSPSDESRSCLGCGYEGDSSVALCPECGGKMFRPKSLRGRGWFAIILGLFLVIFIGVVTINEAINVYHAGEPGAKVRYTSGPEMRIFLFSFLGFFLSFGIVTIIYGIWLILYGKPNKHLKTLLLGMFSVFMATATLVQLLG